jgi:hypothetical protein
MQLLNPKNVIDVGCGLGAWLNIFSKYGVSDILGVDGDYIDENKLIIPKENFKKANLGLPLDLKKKFDLAICLEVAEHLPPSEADSIVETLINHSDTILFSAAIINQGGQNHINEQWFSYWEKKFHSHGYTFYDIIRPQIWYNQNVDWWYKQNIFIVSKKTINQPSKGDLICGYHPDWFSKNAILIKDLEEGNYSIKKWFYYLKKSITRKFINEYNDSKTNNRQL